MKKYNNEFALGVLLKPTLLSCNHLYKENLIATSGENIIDDKFHIYVKSFKGEIINEY